MVGPAILALWKLGAHVLTHSTPRLHFYTAQGHHCLTKCLSRYRSLKGELKHTDKTARVSSGPESEQLVLPSRAVEGAGVTCGGGQMRYFCPETSQREEDTEAALSSGKLSYTLHFRCTR